MLKEIWAIYNPRNNLFDRIVLQGWRIRRQQLCMNANTGELHWHNVPIFPCLKRRAGVRSTEGRKARR